MFVHATFPHPHRWWSWLAVLAVLSAWTRAGECTWQTYKVSDGLAGPIVASMLEDHRGALWFATADGVSRFDGLRWTTFTTANSGLATDLVNSIFEDPRGNLWFGCVGDGSGLCRFNPDSSTWATYPLYNLTTMMGDHRGEIWTASSGGLYRFDPDSSKWQDFNVGSPVEGGVVAMFEDHAGNLWFGTWLGNVFRYSPASGQWRGFPDLYRVTHQVTMFYEDSSGAVWLSSLGDPVGRYRPDLDAWDFPTQYSALFPYGSVSGVAEDQLGNLWFGSSYGAARFDGAHWRVFNPTTAPGVLSNAAVGGILPDHSGNLWFASPGLMAYCCASGLPGGVSRYDGVDWELYASADTLGIPPDVAIRLIYEDRNHDFWLAFRNGNGVLRRRAQGEAWTEYNSLNSGLGYGEVRAISEDRAGNLWFATKQGASRFDPRDSTWMNFTHANTNGGLCSDWILDMKEDSLGNLWFSTYASLDSLNQEHPGGFSRLDGITWTAFPGPVAPFFAIDASGVLWFATDGFSLSRFDPATGQTSSVQMPQRPYPARSFQYVSDVFEDQAGTIWCGLYREDDFHPYQYVADLARYDPGQANWTLYSSESAIDARPRAIVTSIAQDRSGLLWFGTLGGGIHSFNGEVWKQFTIATTDSGLPADTVTAVAFDHLGRLWAGAPNGLVLHHPDRSAPQTVLSVVPLPLSTSRVQSLPLHVAYGETDGIEYSYSIDDSSQWSPWSPTEIWLGNGLIDGSHSFAVRARDWAHNVDPTPATAVFEIDATPPEPLISAPAFGDAVRDSILIRGTARDARFERFRVEARPVNGPTWTLLASSSIPASSDTLAGWNTRTVPDGNYELRVSVDDTLGLTGTAVTRVVVDNAFPGASETSPAVVVAAIGGNVYGGGDGAHLYFPPHALSQDAKVTIDPADSSQTPMRLASGAHRVSLGVGLGWPDAILQREAVLDLRFPSAASDLWAVYDSVAGQSWQRLGGTLSREQNRISLPITQPGWYAIFADSLPSVGPIHLTDLNLTPRVFSPRGNYANAEVAIGFVLGQPGSVTVKIFNRAGRLVREVWTSAPASAGLNLARWDGRDRDGQTVAEGLYIVSVEAGHEHETSTVAVIR
jgi:ligand-binding sensor domain-containing protein